MSLTSPNSFVARVIAIGFAAGAAVHAMGFTLMLLGIELYGPGYPGWRHAVMSLVDASIAWVALRQQRWLFVVLPLWAAEQAVVNGFGLFSIFALVAVTGLAWERWGRRRPAPTVTD